jgi:hypothetical protein
MTCEEKTALLAKYQQVTREYSETLTELKGRLGTSSKAEFDGLYRLTHEARDNAAKAMREIENHIIDHGC